MRLPAHAVRARASGPVVREVMDVLIANAEHHGEGAVTLALRAQDGWLALDVTDEGPGFADPERAFLRGAGPPTDPGTASASRWPARLRRPRAAASRSPSRVADRPCA